MGRLTVGLIERAKVGKCHPGKYRDGDGLALVVGPRSASWVLRYQLNGRRRDLGLGSLQLLGLARARDLAHQHRVKIRIDRLDPVVDRRVNRQTAARHSVTFAQATDAFIQQQVSMNAWRDPRAEKNWRASLANHAKALNGLRVCDIDAADVEDVLRVIWATKTSTAINVRGRIEKVWTFAKRRGWCDGENPAVWRGGLEANLPKPRQVKPENQPRKAVPWRRLPSVYRDLAATNDLLAAFIRFTISTVARAGEVRGARWTDIDLETREWDHVGHAHEGWPHAHRAPERRGHGDHQGATPHHRLPVPQGRRTQLP